MKKYITLTLLTLAAACGGQDPTLEFGQGNQELIYSSPTCNDVISYALGNPLGTFTIARVSYNARESHFQAWSGVSSTPTGLQLYTTSVDGGHFTSLTNLDLRLRKVFLSSSPFVRPTQMATQVEVMAFNGNTTVTDRTFVPISHCAVYDDHAAVVATDSSGRTVAVTFWHEYIGG